MRGRRASSGVGPRPVTLRTRPPAVTISPSRRAVPAWVISTPVERRGFVEPRDHVALRRGLRDSRPRRARRSRPSRRRSRPSAPASPPGSRLARQRSTRSERSRGSTAWVSGSPKRQLNSSTLGPSRGHHQPGVEDAVVGRPAARERLDDGPVDEVGELLDALGVETRARASSCPSRRCWARRRRRRSACSPAPGPAGATFSPVAERQQRELLALEVLLEDDRRSRRSAARRRTTSTASRASSSVAQMITPLPAASPSAFSTAGRRRTETCSSASSRLRSTACAAVGTPASAISSLAWSFEPSSRAASALGPKAAIPASSSASTRPATSGASGPTTTRSTASSRAAATSAVDVLGADVEAARVGRDPGVAGRAEDLGRARGARQRAHDRVLAPAASDDEDLQSAGRAHSA